MIVLSRFVRFVPLLSRMAISPEMDLIYWFHQSISTRVASKPIWLQHRVCFELDNVANDLVSVPPKIHSSIVYCHLIA